MILCISSITFLFNLTLWDVLIVLAVDTVSFILVHPIEKKVFYSIHPKFRALFGFNTASDLASITSFNQQQTTLNLLAEYPEKRAIFIFFLSLFKVFPAGIMSTLLSGQNFSFLEGVGLFYLAEIIVLFYCSSLVFIQSHNFTSSTLAELKTYPSWRVNYRNLNLNTMSERLYFLQNTVSAIMLVSLLCIMLYSGANGFLQSPISFVIMFSSGILCIVVIQFKIQNFFRNSLVGMFDKFNQKLDSPSELLVPLHTSPILAGFEYSFNQLGYKLEQREKEIANWLKRESEQFHLKALGEITALVAHDIKTPLHVMQMSLEVLNDPAASSREKEKYSQILEKNLNQTISFTQSLMAHLKGVKDTSDCRFGEVHQHLIDILSTQFSSQNFHLVDFDISDELKEFRVGVNRLDAMHVFSNIYHNAIRAVLGDSKPEKRIKLWSEDNGAIYLYDNGPGLSKEEFNQFISYERFGEKDSFNRSLGLRLTHTLLKRLGGELELIPVSEGTCYKIRLPLSDSSTVPNWSQLHQGQTAPLNDISQI